MILESKLRTLKVREALGLAGRYVRMRVISLVNGARLRRVSVFVACIVSILLVSIAGATPVSNRPYTVYQPDGTRLELQVSGDEFFSWVHSADGAIVVQNSAGQWVYANHDNSGKLVASSKRVNRLSRATNPTTIADIDVARNSKNTPFAQYAKNHAVTRYTLTGKKLPVVLNAPGATSAVPNPLSAPTSPLTSSTSLKSLVVFIRFAGEAQWINSTKISQYDQTLNSGDASMKKGIEAQSEGDCSVSSVFPAVGGTNQISYQDIYTRNYYLPYNASANPSGYSTFDERQVREHALLQRAVQSVAGATNLPSGAELDQDSNGYVDSVTFVASGSKVADSILWGHSWSLYDPDYTVSIQGKQVYDFTFQMDNQSHANVFMHEFMHLLGFPDLYRYSYDGGDPVGDWDIMATTSLDTPGQMGNAYMRKTVANWGPAIGAPSVSASNTLVATSRWGESPATPRAYALKIGTTQYLVAEYRSKMGVLWDTGLPVSGVILYRVDTSVADGNMDGPPDGYYIYREDISTLTSAEAMPLNAGTLATNKAALSLESGRASFGSTSVLERSIFTADGTMTENYISEVGSSAGATTSFRLTTSPRHTVSFDVAGGVPAISPITVDAGTLATEPTPPTRAGYTFDGWYTDKYPCINRYDFSAPVVQGEALTAKWRNNSANRILAQVNSEVHTLNYHTGFDAITYSERTIDLRTDRYQVALTPGTPFSFYVATDNDYMFLELRDSQGNLVAQDAEGSKMYSEISGTAEGDGFYTLLVTMTDEVVTRGITTDQDYDLSVSGSVISSYDVAFVSNGGSAVKTTSALPWSTVSKPTDPTRTSYTFDGWYSDAALTDSWSFDTDIVTSDITLYAKWTRSAYVVTFDSQLGSSVNAVSATPNATIAAPTAPTRMGYTFSGWYREPSCTTPWVFSTDTVTSDITLYAKWTFSGYVVTFDSQSGSSVSAIPVVPNTLITAPADPTRAGYTFAGWYREPSFTTPWDFGVDTVSSNTTLYARWVSLIKVQPSSTVTLAYRTPISITVQLQDQNGAIMDTAVKVYRMVSGARQLVPTDLVTDSRGYFSYPVTLPENTQFVFSYDIPWGSQQVVEQLFTIYVKAKFSTPKLSTSPVYKGRRVTVSGLVYPRHTSSSTVTFYIREKVNGRWVTRIKASRGLAYASSSASKYTYSYVFPRKGTWRVYVYHGDATHAGAYSPYKDFYVR